MKLSNLWVALSIVAILSVSSCTKEIIPDSKDSFSNETNGLKSSDLENQKLVVSIISDETFTHEQYIAHRQSFIQSCSRLLSFIPDSVINVNQLSLELVAAITHLERGYLDHVFLAEQKKKSILPHWAIRRVVYSYNTTNHEGKPCVLSAEAVYPISKVNGAPHYIDNISCFCSPLVLGVLKMPSEIGSFASGRCYFNSLVVSADYEGNGINAGYSGAQLDYKISARQQLDAIMAAQELLAEDKNTFMADDYFTYNFGCSRGGAISLALAKYLDIEASQDEKDAIKLKKSVCCTGPYIQDLFLEHILNSKRLGQYNCFFGAFAINDMLKTHPELTRQYSVDDYLSESAKSFSVPFMGKNYDLFQLFEDSSVPMYIIGTIFTEIGTKPMDYVRSDILDENGKLNVSIPCVRDLVKAIEEDDLSSNWKPVHPIIFGYMPDDEVVPDSMQILTQERLKAAAGKEVSITLQKPMFSKLVSTEQHTIGTVYYLLELLLQPMF